MLNVFLFYVRLFILWIENVIKCVEIGIICESFDKDGYLNDMYYFFGIMRKLNNIVCE